MFNPFDEFPHRIAMGSREIVGVYPKEKRAL